MNAPDDVRELIENMARHWPANVMVISDVETAYAEGRRVLAWLDSLPEAPEPDWLNPVHVQYIQTQKDLTSKAQAVTFAVEWCYGELRQRDTLPAAPGDMPDDVRCWIKAEALASLDVLKEIDSPEVVTLQRVLDWLDSIPEVPRPFWEKGFVSASEFRNRYLGIHIGDDEGTP